MRQARAIKTVFGTITIEGYDEWLNAYGEILKDAVEYSICRSACRIQKQYDRADVFKEPLKGLGVTYKDRKDRTDYTIENAIFWSIENEQIKLPTQTRA